MYYYIFVSSRAATICGAGWQPAADWQSACRWHFLGSRRDACIVLRLAAMWGRLPTCGGLLIRLLWGRQSWLQPAFGRLTSSRDSSVSAARDAPVKERLSLV